RGFFFGVLLRGYAFRYGRYWVCWDRLLAGRCAGVITRLYTPPWYYGCISGARGVALFRATTLMFCGTGRVVV
ncbi:flavodoxin family protein, partial [Stenotrophomonas maltophilia]